ncbi:MAG: hypothetical protein LR008_00320 [Candidatus Pacebacteria bacterium]|nr:hypothetical protein [Candidatus Paceibacterota bacterium]
MQKLFTKFIDLLFPLSIEEKMIQSVTPATIKTLYSPNIYRNITYLYRYSEKIVQTAIIENKFHNNPQANKLLGRMLNQWVSRQPYNIILIPIPLGSKRLRQRGHNQVETILKECKTKFPVNNTILKRIIETKPQSKLQRKQRNDNVKNIFACTSDINNIPANSHLVLVDDVVTTGATLLSAKSTLMKHLPISVTVSCIAVAH